MLLTTHYMFEADALCDVIALINRGKIVVIGTPDEIKRQFSGMHILEITLKETRPGLADEIRALKGVARVDQGLDGAFQKLTVHVPTESSLRGGIESKIGEHHMEYVVERDPTLEEAYLSLLRN